MDWTNRDTRQNQPINQPAGHSGVPGGTSGHKKKLKDQGIFRGTSIILLFLATLLIILILFKLIAFTYKSKTEGDYVDTSKFQAVFLNGGQVYFGQIKTLNNKYIRVDNIFYLRVNQTVQPNGQQQNSAPELVPLGCELHRPQNEMVINREQIIFWENLKDDSSDKTVPGAIAKYVKDNPNGQKTCATPATTPATTTPTKP